MGGPAPAGHPAESRTQTALLSPRMRRGVPPAYSTPGHPHLAQLPSPRVFLTARLPRPWISPVAWLLSRLVASPPAPPPRPSVPSPRVSLHGLAPLSRGLPHGLAPLSPSHADGAPSPSREPGVVALTARRAGVPGPGEQEVPGGGSGGGSWLRLRSRPSGAQPPALASPACHLTI